MALREEKISCFISKEARTALDKACLTYDSPQGKLINRMILNFCKPSEITSVKDRNKVKKSKPKNYPKNLDEQFELLWCAKGKKGSKQKAHDKYKVMMEDATVEECSDLVSLLVEHIESMVDEIGFKELHLTTYINQKRWES